VYNSWLPVPTTRRRQNPQLTHLASFEIAGARRVLLEILDFHLSAAARKLAAHILNVYAQGNKMTSFVIWAKVHILEEELKKAKLIYF
jgi:hypothetical protein